MGILMTMISFSIMINLSSSQENATICGESYSIQSNYIPIFTFSGNDINEMGNYQGCLQNSNFSYFIASVTGPIPNLFQGFCLPNTCTAEYLNANSGTIFNQLSSICNEIEQNYTKVCTEFNLACPNLTLKCSNLAIIEAYSFSDPTEINYENNFAYYFTYVLLGVLLAIVLVGTFKNYKLDDRSKLSSNNESIDLTNESILQSSTMEKFFDCFDAIKNFTKLFHTKMNESHDQDLGVLNGIRSLSFFMVIYGHEYFIRATTGTNIAGEKVILAGRWWIFMNSALYAVDVFFFISGFLNTFVLIDKLKKMRISFLNYCTILFHRYFRIMPSYFVAIMINWKLSTHWGSGPLWSIYVNNQNTMCNSKWWSHVLFIDNWVSTNSDYCFGWGWYLSCEFQMFLLTPIFLWIYVKSKSVGKLVLLLFVWFLVAITLLVCFLENVVVYPVNEMGETAFEWYYIKPWTRGAPYFLGIYLGIYYKEWKSKNAVFPNWMNLLKESRPFRVIISLFGLAIIEFVTWIVTPLQDNTDAWSDDVKYIWSAVCRTLYILGIFWFIWPSMFGKNRVFRSFLNNGFFLVMARLSYAGYLIHYIIISVDSYGSQGNFIDTNWDLLLQFFSTLILASFGAILMILLVESPFVNIELTFFRKRMIKKSVDENRETNLSISLLDTKSKEVL